MSSPVILIFLKELVKVGEKQLLTNISISKKVNDRGKKTKNSK